MQTVTARQVLDAHPARSVAVRYLDDDDSEALSTFSSLAVALLALCYDAGVRRVLAVTVHATDGPLALVRHEIDLLMEKLYAPQGDGAASDNGFPDLGSLADHVATLARSPDLARPLIVPVGETCVAPPDSAEIWRGASRRA
jgi:hypothetical protein